MFGSAHLQELAQRVKTCYAKYYQGEDLSDEGLLYAARQLWEDGHLKDAEELNRLVIDLFQAEHGADDDRTLMLKSNLTCILADQGRYGEAESCGLKALGSFPHSDGEESRIAMLLKTCLGRIYRLQGQWTRSKELCCDVVRVASNLYGQDHELTLTAKHQLAGTYGDLRQWDSAKLLMDEVTTIRINKFGFSDRDSLSACSTYANILHHLGRWDEARDLQFSILQEISSQRLPKSLPWTFESVKNDICHLLDSGQYYQAEIALQSVILERAKMLSPKHPDVLDLKHWLSKALCYQHKSLKATEVARNVLELRRDMLGDQHPATSAAEYALAWIESSSISLDSFESTIGKVLAFRRSVMGEDNADTLDAEMSMAWIRSVNGSWKEVDRIFAKVTDAQRRVDGEEQTPGHLGRLQQMAKIFTDNGLHHKAEPLLRKCYSLSMEVFGTSHEETLRAQVQLAYTLSAQHRHEEAEAAIDSACGHAQHILEANHPCRLEIKVAQARIEERMPSKEEGESLYEQNLESYRDLYGEHHPEVIFAELRVARVCLKLRKFKKAEDLYKHAIEVAESVFGPHHRFLAELHYRTANLKFAQRNWKKASKLYQQALLMHSRTLVNWHRQILKIRSKLAMAVFHWGHWRHAESLMTESAKLAESHGQNHPARVATIVDLAWLCCNQKRWPDALELCKDVLERREKRLGKDHPTTLAAQSRLAGVCMAKGDISDALAAYTYVLERRIALLGPEHPCTLHSLINVARCHGMRGHWSLAKAIHEQVTRIQSTDCRVIASLMKTKRNLAKELCRSGLYGDSRKQHEEALHLGSLHGMESHLETAKAHLAAAKFYSSHGPLTEAAHRFQAAIDIYSSTLGMPFELLRARMDLACFYDDHDNTELAVATGMAALQESSLLSTPGHSAVIEAEILFAHILSHAGRAREVMAMVRELVKQVTAQQSRDPTRHDRLMRSLAALLLKHDQHFEGEHILRDLLHNQDLAHDITDSRVLYTFQSFARAKYKAGNYFLAEEILRGVLNRLDAGSIDSIKPIARVKANLARVMVRMGKYVEAETLETDAIQSKQELMPIPNVRLLSHMETLAHIKIHLRKYDEAERILLEVVELRKELQHIPNPATMATLARLTRLREEPSRAENESDLDYQASNFFEVRSEYSWASTQVSYDSRFSWSYRTGSDISTTSHARFW